MSFVVQKSSQYLGTNLDGEIIFGTMTQGLKPLVFTETLEAWETLRFAFPDMDIRIDPNSDRAYEVIDDKTVRFLAGLKMIKDLIYTVPKPRTKIERLDELKAIRAMCGENFYLMALKELENETI